MSSYCKDSNGDIKAKYYNVDMTIRNNMSLDEYCSSDEFRQCVINSYETKKTSDDKLVIAKMERVKQWLMKNQSAF